MGTPPRRPQRASDFPWISKTLSGTASQRKVLKFGQVTMAQRSLDELREGFRKEKHAFFEDGKKYGDPEYEKAWKQHGREQAIYNLIMYGTHMRDTGGAPSIEEADELYKVLNRQVGASAMRRSLVRDYKAAKKAFFGDGKKYGHPSYERAWRNGGRRATIKRVIDARFSYLPPSRRRELENTLSQALTKGRGWRNLRRRHTAPRNTPPSYLTHGNVNTRKLRRRPGRYDAASEPKYGDRPPRKIRRRPTRERYGSTFRPYPARYSSARYSSDHRW
jgi:hypothetical protein